MRYLALVCAGLATSLLACACNKTIGDMTPVGPLPDETFRPLSFNGRLVSVPSSPGPDQAWADGSGQLQLSLILDGINLPAIQLVTTALQSDGTFRFDLTREVALGSSSFFTRFSYGCPKNFNLLVTNKNAKIGQFRFDVTTNSGTDLVVNKFIKKSSVAGSTISSIVYSSVLYSNEANSLYASQNCTLDSKPTTFSFDFKLSKGWNTYTETYSTIRTTPTAPPTYALTLKTEALLDRWIKLGPGDNQASPFPNP